MAKDHLKITFRYKNYSIHLLKDTEAPDYITEKIEAEKNFYEIDLLSWLEDKDIPKGDFIDVGANIGNHSLFFAKVMKRKTWSFEPYAPAFQLLERNLTVNKLDTSRCFPFGLSSKDTKANIILPDSNNIGAARVSIDGDSGSVELRRGDEVLADIRKIALMKIDVEGHELDVLKGCLGTIEKHHPLLLVECMNMEEYEKVNVYVEPLGYVPSAVFGATPMIVFKYYDRDPEDMRVAVSEILDRYFQLDDKYRKTRESITQYADKIANNNFLRSENADLKNRNHVLEINNRKYEYLKKEYKNIKNSKTYKIGSIVILPVRKLKKIVNTKREG